MANENRLVGVKPNAADIAGFEFQAGFIERADRIARMVQELQPLG